MSADVIARVRRQTEKYMDTAYYDPSDMRTVLDAASRAEEWAALCDKLADVLVEIRDGECNDRVHQLACDALDLLP